MYSVMWSEHCSYKSSRVHLRRFPTEAPWVLVGPGENAGVVDVGDGIAVALRIESHNHPSAIEPYQGAATGIGGIVRDIFTMGARPIALMDPLRFGPLDDAAQPMDRRRRRVGGVGLRQLGGHPHGGRRGGLRRDLPREPAGERVLPGHPAHRAPGAGPGVRRGQRGGAAGQRHGPRRHRRGERAGIGRVRRRGATTPPSGPASRWATRSRRSA